MTQEFLDKEASEIINRLTNNPFAIDGQLWYYWLFRLELIPGGWTAEFYLEENFNEKPQYVYDGWGDPSGAVKEAYGKIDKEWLEKGFKEGKILQEEFDKHHAVDRKKWEYWTHYLQNDQYWGNRFTETRLGKARVGLWEDKGFWDDILIRHDGNNLSPDQMKEKSLSVYEHMMGNMTGMIMRYFIANKIIPI